MKRQNGNTSASDLSNNPLQIFAALRVSVLALEAGIPLGWGEELPSITFIANIKLYGLGLEILVFSLKSFVGGGTFITAKITQIENKNILALKLKPYGLGGLELSLFNFSLFGEVGFPPVFTNLGVRYDF